ncbi:MAG: glucose-6-phosphate isomerase [Christensenellaceae bacterium]|jgi:glucose-6-phosphate isomerase|nr:glucose-6-phosphate isomerase [Christensenellaceae bacterium]
MAQIKKKVTKPAKVETQLPQITFDYNNMMASHIGEEGLRLADFETSKDDYKSAFNYVKMHRGTEWLRWTELPYNQLEKRGEEQSIVSEILETAKQIRKDAEYFVVLGIGGSALGPMAVFQALCNLRHNDLKRAKRGAPKFYVEDNVDPERMNSLFGVIDLKKTVFNVITKSGSTSETMSQFLIIWDILKAEFGDEAKNHIVATTDAEKGNLIKIAKKEGIKTFVVPDGVGGRFSELCPVGLLPAAVLNIDIKKLLKGAAAMDKRCKDADIKTNPALAAALTSYLAMKRGKNVSVMMPYADSLKLIADWYCQLWGESLGKNVTLDGTAVNVGQTPVKALGVTDQHSQIQLYTEGPFDKIITFISVENFRSDIVIPKSAQEYPNVAFLAEHTMGELIKTELLATEYALMKNKRMNATIKLPEVSAYTIGQLLEFFMLETAYAGALLNIDTFNQPGVEEGKNATYALFGRTGYEEKAFEINSAPKKLGAFIV